MAKILSADLAEALQGADEVLAAGTEDEHLKGLRYGGTSRRIWVVELQAEGCLANLAAPQFRVRQMAMLRLVAGGRSALAETLRAKVKHLALLGTDARWVYGKVTKDPIDLRPLEGLRLEVLELQNASAVTWGEMPTLKSLTLQDAAASSLPASPNMETLNLGLCALRSVDLSVYPRLKVLHLNNRQLSEVRGLEHTSIEHLYLNAGTRLKLKAPATLKDLRWSGGAGEVDISEATALEDIHLTDYLGQDLCFLAECPRLKQLHIRTMGQLTSLEGLPVEHLEQLDLNNCPELEDISALGGAPKLSQLNLSGSAKLQELRGLELGLPELSNVTLSRLTNLHSLKGLGAAPKLSRLNVQHCASLALATGLGDCKQLKSVQFYHCSKKSGLDLSGLEGATPTSIQVTGTRVGKTRIPEALWPVVRPPSAISKGGKRTKSDKPAPKQATGAARGQAARLKKLIMSRDLDRIDQAAELVGILGEEVSCAIADGCTLALDRPLSESLPSTAHGTPACWDATWDRMVPNSLLDHKDLIMAYRGHAMRVLAAAGAAPQLASIRSVVMVGRTKRSGGLVPVRLDPVAELPALDRVGVYCASELEGLEQLDGLRRLCLHQVAGVESVAEVAGPRELVLDDNKGAMKGIGMSDKLGNLERLEFDTGWRGGNILAAEVRRLRGLRYLNIQRGGGIDDGVAEALASLPHLESLDLNQHEIKTLELLEGMKLKHLGLRLQGTKLPIANRLALESLTLYGADLGALQGLEAGPRTLSLYWGSGAFNADQVGCKDSVEELVLRCNMRGASLGGLSRWPKLQRLTLSRRSATADLRARYKVTII